MSMLTSIASSAFVLLLAPAPAEPQYLPSTVEVDVEPLVAQAPDEGEDLRRLERITSERTGSRVLESVQKELEQHGVPVGAEAPTVKIVVTLEWKVYIESHYIVRIVAQHRNGTEQAVTLECKMCDEPKLAAAVAARVPELLPSLEVVDEPVPAAVPVTGSEPSTEVLRQRPVPVGGEPLDARRVRRIGPAGWVGLGAGVAGVSGIVAGAVILSREDETAFPNDFLYWDRTNSRLMGRSLLGVGGAVLVVGTVLFVVDQTVLKKRRRRRLRGSGGKSVDLYLRRGVAFFGRF